jgi:hypothetical protein
MMARRKRGRRESAPVQVYLDSEARGRLARLAAQLEATRSDVLRQGLEALERAVMDPGNHPALQVIGLANRERAGRRTDAAREHDRVLTDEEEKGWSRSAG